MAIRFKAAAFCAAIALSGIVGGLSGCSDRTLTSRHVEEFGSPKAPISGLYYYLPRGVIPISVRPSKETGFLEVTQGGTQLFPDRHAKYLLERHESETSDDVFSIAVDENGLLTAINSDTHDRSPDIVKKVIEIAATMIAPGYKVEGLEKTEEKKSQPCRVEALIDPFSHASVSSAGRALQKCGLNLEIKYPYENESPTPKNKGGDLALAAEATNRVEECDGSICFRPVVPVSIRLRGTAPDSKVDAAFLAVVPDVRSVAAYDVTRGPCIQRVNTLTFNHGLLTKAELNKPSEVLSCLEIPLAIAKAFASIPSQVLTFKVEQATKEASLLQQERNIIVAQQALMQARLSGR